MRSYLAVLKDSFREALASRVLWVVLITTTVVLIFAAPAGISEVKTPRLTRTSVRNWPELAAKIDRERRAEGPSPGKQLWSRFSDELREEIGSARDDGAAEDAPGVSPLGLLLLIGNLNAALEDRTLYDPEAWQASEPADEAQEYLARGVASLSQDEVLRLNRLLLRAAYPAEISPQPGTEFYFSYLTMRTDTPLPLTRAKLTAFVEPILAKIVDYVVGVFGVFVAILVTASIIPQMFEPGAIDLLLSKPISRTLLFLTKFAGGCIFIGLIAAYFIAGLWLIAGSRFGLWNHRLFLCVPLLVFLFAVYYSVSALAGALWRNAIVSILVTILFWAACFVLWFFKSGAEEYLKPVRLLKVVSAGQTLLGLSASGAVCEWSPQNAAWLDTADDQSRFGPQPRRIIGPVFDAARQRLVSIEAPNGGAGGFGLFSPAATMKLRERSKGWAQSPGAAPPAGALALLASPNGDLVIVTKSAVYRLAAAKTKAAIKSEKFVRAGPEPALRLDQAGAFAIDPDSGAIFTFHRSLATVLELDPSGKYVRKVEKTIEAAEEVKEAVAAFGGETIALAFDDGRVLILGAADLALKQTLTPRGRHAPQTAFASPGGRWVAVLFQNRQLWIYDVKHQREAYAPLRGQGDISAAAFDGSDRLLAADRGRRVTGYRLDPFRLEETFAEPLGKMDIVYHYLLNPLYTIFPKPGELGKAVSYLLEKQEIDPIEQNLPGFADKREEIDVAGPVWSSLAFLAVMLTLSCLYVWRSDF